MNEAYRETCGGIWNSVSVSDAARRGKWSAIGVRTESGGACILLASMKLELAGVLHRPNIIM
jgi:hypothetical protein